MKTTDNFFAAKREWSILKDQILDYYLTPYLGKILSTKRPTRIADCFAGKGRFDDGSDGSPLIIARHIEQETQRDATVDLKGIFIEKKFAGELRDTLSIYGDRCVVLEGDYEERLKFFLAMPTDKKRNYFLYVDPYGIKSLSFSHFAGVKSLGFNSTEVLMNLNTTGFLREGCRLLKLTREAPDWAQDLEHDIDGKNTSTHMDEVAGGIYWREILQNFEAGAIDFNQAEVCFTKNYVAVMRRVFQYVVDIPIKERSHHLPKYRLIFAGDHIDGLILMVDSMHKAWQILRRKERRGQLYLFDDDELTAIEHRPAQDLIWDALCEPRELTQLLAELIMRHGIAYTGKEYCDAIRSREGKMFTVERTPPLTPTGRKAISMDYKDYKIVVGRKSKQENLF